MPCKLQIGIKYCGNAMTQGKVQELFYGLQRKLETSLEVGRTVHNHPGTKGDVTESDWLGLFRQHLPTRYQATKGFVADCRGGCSEQIDIIIHDRQYTPCLYNSDGAVYIPAESVYAILEVKQEINKDLLAYANKKVESVRALYRTSAPYAHHQGTGNAKTPHHIIGGILALESKYSPAFSQAFTDNFGSLKLDIGCCLKYGAFELVEDKVSISETNLGLATFFMLLLDKLRMIGTVPAMDYRAYLDALK